MLNEIADRSLDMSDLKEERISNFTECIKNLTRIFDEKLCVLIIK